MSMSSEETMAAFLVGFYIGYLIAIVIICVVAIVGNWFIFKKAGYEGWKALIPFYNSWVLAEFTWGHGAFMFLPFIPFVGGILALYSQYKVAAAFGKGIGFTLGYIFLWPIFHLILAFDKSTYIGVSKNFWEN